MAVTRVVPHSQGCSGNATGTDNGTVKAAYRSAYRVTCNSAADSCDEVLYHFRTTASLPWMGRRFKFGNGFNAAVTCKSVEATYVENSDGQHIVACTFETPAPPQSQSTGQDANGNQTDNPLRWHDDIDVSFTYLSVPVEQAQFVRYDPPGRGGKYLKPGYVGPLVNSALIPFDPTIEDVLPIKIIRITKYLREYNPGPVNDYINAINSDYVTINKPAYRFREFFSPYRGLIVQLQANFQIENSIPYYRQTLEVHVHPLINGWRTHLADRGLTRAAEAEDPDGTGEDISESDIPDPAIIVHEPVKDRSGYPIAEPVLFDGNGQPMNRDGRPVYLIYKKKNEKPFSRIGW